MKYIISYSTKFGAIAAESKKPQDIVDAYTELKKLASKIERSSSRHAVEKVSARIGKGETTEILRALNSKLLTTDFFSKPRTTGETREKLTQLVKKRFTSRKVSQALGILHEKRALRRTGKRNSFRYSTV